MSSRGDYRRHERDWERDDRDRDRYSRGGGGRGGKQDRGGYRDEQRRRSSRSRSPRRVDRDRRGDRRDHRRDDDRYRDSEGRSDGRGRGRGGGGGRGDGGRDDRRREEREHPRDGRRDEGRREEPKRPSEAKERSPSVASQAPSYPGKLEPGNSKLEENVLDDEPEEGEEMDAINEEDAAMMAMMGVSGFGSTKGKHVTGNQEGSVNIKRERTWRQYMNRRGGFNRPLDKIK